MFNLILASHGGFAKGLLEAGEFIAGKQENVETFGLYLGDDIEEFSQKLKESVERADTGEGVLVLTDLKSGSPFNATVGSMTNPNIRHFTGMNMPMLLTVLCERPYMSLDDVCKTLLEESTSAMADVNKMLDEISSDEEEEE